MGLGSLIKARMAYDELVVGVTVNFVHAGLTEFLGNLGFDCVVIDGEHGPVVDSCVEDVARAAALTQTASIIRLPVSGPQIERYLGMGLSGLHIPRVRTVAEAEEVTGAARFLPLGTRSVGNFRASDFGLREGWPTEMMRTANGDTIVMVAIEDQEGIDALPSLLKMPGIDVILIGEGDLSDSLGLVGQKDHPTVRAASDAIASMCLAANRPFGLGADSAAGVRAARERGASYILTSVTSCLRGGAAEILAEARKN
ncbi:2-dehydro-3-deoxyglucarate aldolase [Pseudonocardia ailaonensis]|uniref:2-dehydro-3-deoxyglucarate aldolase n=1 Tax=Pseudonocardia ailaonensis TaxID=367279 RepID=A0ABN2MZF9_9PSEU